MNDSKPDLRTQILDSAFRCLARKGSAATSLRDVAGEAGVALSQIHYYFGSKEGLLVAAASYVIRQSVAELQAELKGVPDAPDRVRRAIRFLRQSFLQRPECVKVYLDLLSMAAWIPALAAETSLLQAELVELVLAEASTLGCHELQSRAVARVVLGALDGLALQALQGAPSAEMDAAYEALELLLVRQLESKGDHAE